MRSKNFVKLLGSENPRWAATLDDHDRFEVDLVNSLPTRADQHKVEKDPAMASHEIVAEVAAKRSQRRDLSRDTSHGRRVATVECLYWIVNVAGHVSKFDR